ncbi:MAG: metal-sulfur cluster assembly factor [Gemmatimonadaceae bacterium]|nr:metal-sulfur cluster assembly factor [Gemmatimonadaceae bacterium]
MTDPQTPAAESADHGANADAEVNEEIVRLALRRVKDPELNLNIVDLGLVYGITVTGTEVSVDMSLTSPACPSGPEIAFDATKAVEAIPGVTKGEVHIVWSPPWTPERIEPRVRVYLGF